MASQVPDDPVPVDPVLHLGRVDRVGFRVAFVRAPDRSAREVFLLDLPVEPTWTFDETRYLAAFEPIFAPPDRSPLGYALELRRTHDAWESEAGEVEVVLSLAAGAVAGGAEPVVAAFRYLMRDGGVSASPPLARDEAIARARTAVAAAFPVEGAGQLSVSSEQHHATANSWAIGIRSDRLEEFTVLVGLVDGYTRSAQVRHYPAGEVLDSVGVDG